MKKILILLLIGLNCFGQNIFNPKSNHKNSTYLKYKYFDVLYSKEYKQPIYVSYLLTKSMVESGENPLERSTIFKPDPRVQKIYSVEHNDYTNSGYDRGHLAPARDFKFEKFAYYQTFYTTNISPQLKELNRGTWKYLEDKVRDIAVLKDSIIVICGPIYSKNTYIKNNINVPDKFWKIIYKDGRVISYIMDNSIIQKPMNECLTSVDVIENLTGLDFFYWLDDKTENYIESKVFKNF